MGDKADSDRRMVTRDETAGKRTDPKCPILSPGSDTRALICDYGSSHKMPLFPFQLNSFLWSFFQIVWSWSKISTLIISQISMYRQIICQTSVGTNSSIFRSSEIPICFI